MTPVVKRLLDDLEGNNNNAIDSDSKVSDGLVCLPVYLSVVCYILSIYVCMNACISLNPSLSHTNSLTLH